MSQTIDTLQPGQIARVRQRTYLVEQIVKPKRAADSTLVKLSCVDDDIERVAVRVREGGHNIPEDVIRRRYQRGIENLFKLYLPLVADAYIYDGSQLPPELAWESIAGTEREISGSIWNAIQQSRKDKS